VGSLARCRPSA
jgi:hypothetical protein